MDQIKDITVSTMLVYLGVKDSQYFILGFTINFDWRWRQLDSVWNWIWSHEFKHRDMEDSVDCMHAVWKSWSVRVGADLSNNLEGVKIFLGKLLGRLSGPEELRFYKHLRSRFEFQRIVLM